MAYLRILSLPDEPGTRRRCELCVATALGLSFAESRGLLTTTPLTLPYRLDPDDTAFVTELSRLGAGAEISEEEPRGFADCPSHVRLEATERCPECGRYWCMLCIIPENAALGCPECRRRTARRQRFFRFRVGLLLSVLVLVLLVAYSDYRRRSARTDWSRGLNVGVVLLPAEGVPPALLVRFARRFRGLAGQLNAEFRRVRGQPGEAFAFDVLGRVHGATAVPKTHSEGWWGLLQTNYELWRFARDVDKELAVDTSDFDSCIYVAIKRPQDERVSFVEGFSQQGGHLGVVEVELSESSIDFALFVVAHEMFHTLGASDKYAADGRALVPLGLAEPQREPLFPQRYVEIMARNRPVDPDTELPPESLDELRVGPHTAREVGWSGR